MIAKIKERIFLANYIAIVVHKNPDIDALGSAFGLMHTLIFHNKKATVVSYTKDILEEYKFIPDFKKIKYTIPLKCDLVISVDCGLKNRIGFDIKNIELINFDHHSSNDNFGDYNIVDIKKSSTSEVIYSFLESAELKINKPAATSFYAALVSDSRFFTVPRTDAKSFEIAQKLINSGANHIEIADNIMRKKSLAKLRLTGLALSGMELFLNGKVAYVAIREDMLVSSGATSKDSDEIAEILLSLKVVDVSIMAVWIKKDHYKLSFRGKGAINLDKIANKFGGGGHHNAAGLEIKNSDPEEIIEKILKELYELQKEKR